MPKKPKDQPKPEQIIWPRADRMALALFDESTKRCTMNCGSHRDDPRTWAEVKFLCEDCEKNG